MIGDECMVVGRVATLPDRPVPVPLGGTEGEFAPTNGRECETNGAELHAANPTFIANGNQAG